MSDDLKTYRVYCFDSRKKIVTADLVKAKDDHDAVAKATARGFGSQCEVWDGRRLVAQLAQGERSAALGCA